MLHWFGIICCIFCKGIDIVIAPMNARNFVRWCTYLSKQFSTVFLYYTCMWFLSICVVQRLPIVIFASCQSSRYVYWLIFFWWEESLFTVFIFPEQFLFAIEKTIAICDCKFQIWRGNDRRTLQAFLTTSLEKHNIFYCNVVKGEILDVKLLWDRDFILFIKLFINLSNDFKRQSIDYWWLNLLFLWESWIIKYLYLFFGYMIFINMIFLKDVECFSLLESINFTVSEL